MNAYLRSTPKIFINGIVAIPVSHTQLALHSVLLPMPADSLVFDDPPEPPGTCRGLLANRGHDPRSLGRRGRKEVLRASGCAKAAVSPPQGWHIYTMCAR